MSDWLSIHQTQPLEGNVSISGAKNAALPLLAASLWTPGGITFQNMPDIADVHLMGELLKQLGVDIAQNGKEWHVGPIQISTGDLRALPAFSKIRYSMLTIYPILSRFEEIYFPYPGGCELDRSLACHLDPLRWMGFEVEETPEWVRIRRPKHVKGGTIRLSDAMHDRVGMTGSLLLASQLSREPIEILNPALEPEVVEMARFLKKSGVRIDWKSPRQWVIHPASSRTGEFSHPIIPDRIEAGSFLFLMAAARPGSHIHIQNFPFPYMKATLKAARQLGLRLQENDPSLDVFRGTAALHPVQVTARNYPGFPTDLQPILTAAAGFSPNPCTIQDAVFPSRFQYVSELQKLGFNTQVAPGRVELRPPHSFQGGIYACKDLRAGFAGIVAAVGIEAPVELTHASQIARGYEYSIRKLQTIGVMIHSGSQTP